MSVSFRLSACLFSISSSYFRCILLFSGTTIKSISNSTSLMNLNFSNLLSETDWKMLRSNEHCLQAFSLSFCAIVNKSKHRKFCMAIVSERYFPIVFLVYIWLPCFWWATKPSVALIYPYSFFSLATFSNFTWDSNMSYKISLDMSESDIKKQFFPLVYNPQSL